MAHNMESYADALTEAIESVSPDGTPSQVFRETVQQIARRSAADPHTLRTMEIIARYPAARSAETSRLPELQDRVVAAYARRLGGPPGDDLTPMLLAGLTLQVVSVVLHSWFSNSSQDIDECVDRAVSTLDRLVRGGR
jgi:AcrR family transcriptional regulator